MKAENRIATLVAALCNAISLKRHIVSKGYKKEI